MKNLERGQSVLCNGYEGTIVKLCDGQLSGMAEVRLQSGVVCVPLDELIPFSQRRIDSIRAAYAQPSIGNNDDANVRYLLAEYDIAQRAIEQLCQEKTELLAEIREIKRDILSTRHESRDI